MKPARLAPCGGGAPQRAIQSASSHAPYAKRTLRGTAHSAQERWVARIWLLALHPRRPFDEEAGLPVVDDVHDRAVGRLEPPGSEEVVKVPENASEDTLSMSEGQSLVFSLETPNLDYFRTTSRRV